MQQPWSHEVKFDNLSRTESYGDKTWIVNLLLPQVWNFLRINVDFINGSFNKELIINVWGEKVINLRKEAHNSLWRLI